MYTPLTQATAACLTDPNPTPEEANLFGDDPDGLAAHVANTLEVVRLYLSRNLYSPAGLTAIGGNPLEPNLLSFSRHGVILIPAFQIHPRTRQIRPVVQLVHRRIVRRPGDVPRLLGLWARPHAALLDGKAPADMAGFDDEMIIRFFAAEAS